MTETKKCAKCGADNDVRIKYCISCSALMPGFATTTQGSGTMGSHSDSEYLKSIDRTLKTIKNVSIWFLALSIAGLILGILSVAIR
jgi:hypothetical protein